MLRFVVFFLIVAGSFATETSNSASLRHFIEKALENYDAWLKSVTIADPSPWFPVHSSNQIVDQKLLRIIHKLNVEQLSGYVKNATNREKSVSIDMINRKIHISVNTTGKFVLRGNYTATGTLYLGDYIPYAGYGDWNVTINNIQELYTHTIKITPEGYLLFDLETIYMYPTLCTTLSIEESYFESLADTGPTKPYAQEIERQINIEIQKRYENSTNWDNKWRNHPTGSLLHRFINETFTGAPKLNDIFEIKVPELTL